MLASVPVPDPAPAPAPPRPRLSARRKALFALVVTAVVLGGVEATFRVLEARRQSRRGTDFYEDDPLCGYRLKPGLRSFFDADGVERSLVTNDLGHRGPP